MRDFLSPRRRPTWQRDSRVAPLSFHNLMLGELRTANEHYLPGAVGGTAGGAGRDQGVHTFLLTLSLGVPTLSQLWRELHPPTRARIAWPLTRTKCCSEASLPVS